MEPILSPCQNRQMHNMCNNTITSYLHVGALHHEVVRRKQLVFRWRVMAGRKTFDSRDLYKTNNFFLMLQINTVESAHQ